MPAVSLSNVTLAYGATPVLADISLDLAAGQTHSLLGPSGCGKSTLLRALTGLLIPTSGQVRVLDRAVEPATRPAQRLANHAAGLVLQDGGLFPHLTVRDNVILPATLAGWPADRSEPRLAELESLLGLDPGFRFRWVRSLSGGQRQRVALARALFLDPPLLLLDEPLSALDPLSRTELQDEMKRMFRSLGKTVILVTHDIPEALYLADTVTLLDRGRVAQHGPAELLVRHPASEWARTFLGSAVPRWRAILGIVDAGKPA